MKKRIFSIITTAILAINVVSVFTFAKNDFEVGIIKGENDRPAIITTSEQSELKGAVILPDRYSSEELGYTSVVKNQETTSLCWAFTQNEMIEINIAKKTGKKTDYSEQTMKFETSRDFGSFNRSPNGTGNEYISIAYLAQNGSVLEKDEPFDIYEERTADPTTLERHGYLESAPMFRRNQGYDAESIQIIKELVYEYGAVGSSLYYNAGTAQYENPQKTTYYYPVNASSQSPDHAVTIVGWDDTFPATAFSKRPAGNGAFIVKNSWGKYHNNRTDDIFYVSYYDKFVNYQFFASGYESENDRYENVYAYDDYGWVDTGWLTGMNEIYLINKFNAKKESEKLSSVGVYLPSDNVDVKVYIKSDQKDDLYNFGTYKEVAHGYYDYAGYYNIDFDDVYLTKGNFYVMVELTYAPSQQIAYFALQTKNSRVCPNAKNIPNTCYLGRKIENGVFTVQTLESAYAAQPELQPMLCIKAFTKGGTDITLEDSAKKFTDVEKTHWFKPAVDYCITFDIMSGVSDTLFRPLGNVTRAQFAQVLANISPDYDKGEYEKYSGSFTDVKAGDWYNAAVQWAFDNDIVNGVSADRFAPNNTITREQMCTMLYRYMDRYGILPYVSLSTEKFADDADISNYAREAVYTCKALGIINGVSATEFAPKKTANRAQIAQMMTNFAKRYLY